MPNLTHDLGPHGREIADPVMADRILTQATLVVLRYRDRPNTTVEGHQACDDLVEHLRALAKMWGVTL